jgi:DNA (cytosine-5)-methyltransferase 1
MRIDRQPTYLDLFSGCGGLSLGFRQAGYRPLLALDSDPHAVACYNFNLQGDALGAIQTDLGAFRTPDDVATFLESHGIGEGDCDVLVGGPPCQSFSTVGRTKVRALMHSDEKMRERWEEQNAKRTMLFEAYVLFVEYLQPRWFLFENVPAIRSHKAFSRIEARFKSLTSLDGRNLNYTIIPENYWASDYGVPQHRRRFLMVGFRSDIRVSTWLPPDKHPAPSVAEALGDLPQVPHNHKTPEMPHSAEASSEYQTRMRKYPSGAACNTVYNHISRRHNPDDVALFALMAPGARFSDKEVQRVLPQINLKHHLLKYSVEKFQDKLHKLHPDHPSWTVTAHLQKDCYKFIHYSQARTITVREAARLQSFPDGFVFPDSLGPAYRLIGNAVPPLLSAAFGRSFRASDPGLDSTTERVRAILPDEEWRRAQILALGRVNTAREHSRLRLVVAAGALVTIEGKPWADAARILGQRIPHRLERWFNTLQRTGLWGPIQRMLTPPQSQEAELPLDLFPEAPMAAD